MDLKYDIHGEGAPILLIHSPGVDSREWCFVAHAGKLPPGDYL